jgi:transposase
MQDVADQSLAPTTIGADLCAIFVSLELSRSTWLAATSLSPGRGEKMSRHSVPAGHIATLLARFSEHTLRVLRDEAFRTWEAATAA